MTRKNLFVNRITCAWLIRHFEEEMTLLKHDEPETYSPSPGKIRFDMFEGEYTHEGDKCAFEVMIRRLCLQDWGLAK